MLVDCLYEYLCWGIGGGSGGELSDLGGLLEEKVAVEQVERLSRDGGGGASTGYQVRVGGVENGEFGDLVVAGNGQVNRAPLVLGKAHRLVENFSAATIFLGGVGAGCGVEFAGQREHTVADFFGAEAAAERTSIQVP